MGQHNRALRNRKETCGLSFQRLAAERSLSPPPSPPTPRAAGEGGRSGQFTGQRLRAGRWAGPADRCVSFHSPPTRAAPARGPWVSRTGLQAGVTDSGSQDAEAGI